MPKLTVEDVGRFDVSPDKRLVLALEDDAKIDQMHACGGVARCTSCRVQFIAGEPAQMTEAEKQVLAAKGLLDQAGLRLSCQMICGSDMTVKIVNRFRDNPGRVDAGRRPTDEIAPPPVWTTKI